VAISASAMPEDRQRCLAAGMNDFIAKPIKVEDLYAQLSRWAGCATPAAADAPAASGPLPAVAGLDCAEGLQRAMGDRELYLDLLRRLAASEHNAAPAIRCALADRDPGTALRRAHTLKGLLGTVGAIPAMHCAAALEQALRQGAAPAQIEQAIAALETQLTPLLAALEGGLTISEEPAATAVAPEEVAQIRQQLTTYLAEDDAEALNCFNRHAAALRAAFPADYPRLADALRAFEFAQALDVLRHLPSAQPAAQPEPQAR
jgi:two-component system sensor histidine kinase/response regulator